MELAADYGRTAAHPGTVSAFGRMPMRNRAWGVARLCARSPRGYVGIGVGYKSCTRHRGGRKLPQKKARMLTPAAATDRARARAGNTEGLAPETPAAGRRNRDGA